ncbi:hypothetical protein [Nonomuraea basaltis]|uniref:hypothetical protein n=1 Tax=Nonomuraea basaltis TaxID=2495887 RepID=UPI00110C5CFC|nr:hypothetical protein [Nonomuraea basaltis]TMR90158.1 hypothetical protein EJK15_56785 [Nonomuraea basaltis]
MSGLSPDVRAAIQKFGQMPNTSLVAGRTFADALAAKHPPELSETLASVLADALTAAAPMQDKESYVRLLGATVYDLANRTREA